MIENEATSPVAAYTAAAPEQDQNEGIGEAGEQPAHDPQAASLRDLVRSIPTEAPGGVGGREASGAGFEPVHQVANVNRPIVQSRTPRHLVGAVLGEPVSRIPCFDAITGKKSKIVAETAL